MWRRSLLSSPSRRKSSGAASTSGWMISRTTVGRGEVGAPPHWQPTFTDESLHYQKDAKGREAERVHSERWRDADILSGVACGEGGL